jgi:spermidine/putrescine transport system substrate-binding protein
MTRHLLLAALLAPAIAADPVTVFMYSEYIDEKIPEQFEKATGFPLKIEVYEAQEDMLAKLKTGGSDQYDVVVATDVMIKQLIGLKLVKPLDQALIPNMKHVSKDLLNPPYDQGNTYSLPYFWGTAGLMYDTAKVSGEPTWAWIFDAKQQPGPFLMMDESKTMLGSTMLALGKPMNSRDPKDLNAAADALVAAKKSAKSLGFAGGVDGKNKVVAGEAAIAVVYNGDAARGIEEAAAGDKKLALAYAIPKEGGNIWVDCLLVTAKAPNKAGAHAFINYINLPEVAAQNANSMRYATPNASAIPLVDEKDRTNPVIYPGPEIKARLHYLEDAGKATKLLDATWTKVKAD